MEKPEPETRYVHGSVPVKLDAPLSCFKVWHGYKHRNQVQIRLEDDGTVSLFSMDETRYPETNASARVRFGTLVKALPGFIRHLEALDKGGGE